MAPILLVILVVLFAFGILLLAAGWRGRKINDHPVCRSCRFDLSGSYPEVITCPECGAGLKRPKAVQIGMRARMPLALLAGAACLLLSLTPMGMVGYALLTGGDFQKSAPLGVLLLEARYAEGNFSKGAADELLNRIFANKVDNTSYQRIVEATLKRQADRSLSWDEAWGDIIERARFDNQLSPEQNARFTENAANFKITSRERAVAGGSLPVTITASDIRVGKTTSLLLPVKLSAAKIGSVELPLEAKPLAPPSPFGLSGLRDNLFGGGQDDPNQLATFQISGSRPQGLGGLFTQFGTPSAGNTTTAVLHVPKSLPAGNADLQLYLQAASSPHSAGSLQVILNGRRQTTAPQPAPFMFSRTLPVAIESDVAAIVTRQAPDEAITRQLVEQLRPQRASLQSRVDSDYNSKDLLTISFKSATQIAPYCYRVIARSGEAEYPLGVIMSSKDPLQPEPDGMISFSTSFSISINGTTTTSTNNNNASEASVTGVVPANLPQRVDIILRPDPIAATRSPEQAKCYDQELVFRDVVVARDPFGGMDNPAEEMMNNALKRLRNANPPAKRRTPY